MLPNFCRWNRGKEMARIGLLLFILSSTQIFAREDDSVAMCHMVVNDQKGKSYPCVIMDGGGAGTSITEYEFNGNSYQRIDRTYSNEDGEYVDESTINDLPYLEYPRNRKFEIIEDYSNAFYSCYFTKEVHFCVSHF